MKRTQPRRLLAAALLASGLLAGCHGVGPQGLKGTHGQYNQAMVTSLNEQFLQNLVRLRYRDTPYFLEIGNVTASLRVQATVGLESELSTGNGADLLMPNIGIGYSTAPTISYAPLQGEDFLKNVLTPIPLDSLFVLTQSGWSSRRVFGLCVERFNGLQNAPTASGPTPQGPPEGYETFDRLLHLLESVRNKDLFHATLDSETGKMVVQIDSRPEHDQVISEIKELLQLDPDRPFYPVDSSFVRRSPDTISIRTRSIMSMLFYLSQRVEVPVPHEEAGWVTVTRGPGQDRFDWGRTPGGALFTVRSRPDRPKTAYLAVPYRGYWFYIDNNDLESKSTFMLISQLFNLQAGDIKTVGPALTIPVSR